MVFGRRIPDLIAEAGMVLVNRAVLHPLDCLINSLRGSVLGYPPVFIIGPPRSGSTLLMQILSNAFDIGYLSAHHCRYFGAPTLANHLGRFQKERSVSDFRSEYGVVEGVHAPSECWRWWYRFFPKASPYVRLEDVDARRIRCFRRSIAALTSSLGRPVIFKNLYASLRIQVIGRYVPEALFIVMNRDELDNAHSILEGRYRQNGNYDDWFSVPVPGIAELMSLPPEQQAVEQIRRLYALIRADIERAGIESSKVMTVQYESLCDDVHGELERIRQFMKSNGAEPGRRFDVPARFQRRAEVRIDQGLYERLTRLVCKV